MHQIKLKFFVCLFIFISVTIQAQIENTQVDKNNKGLTDKFYLKPHVGISLIQTDDVEMTVSNMNSQHSTDDKIGLNAGITLGYHISEKIAVEVGYNYKMNNVSNT